MNIRSVFPGRPVLAAAVFACGLAARAAEGPPPVPVGGKITWVYRLDEGRRLAREAGKPLFVVVRCER